MPYSDGIGAQVGGIDGHVVGSDAEGLGTDAQVAGSEHTIPDEGLSFDAVVTEVERELLLQSLNKSGGNKMRAARLLNMKRTTFVEKLKRLQIESEEE